MEDSYFFLEINMDLHLLVLKVIAFNILHLYGVLICLEGVVVGCRGNRVIEKNIVGIENKPTPRR